MTAYYLLPLTVNIRIFDLQANVTSCRRLFGVGSIDIDSEALHNKDAPDHPRAPSFPAMSAETSGTRFSSLKSGI
ncbi:hypothetical protein [Halomonas shantousis]